MDYRVLTEAERKYTYSQSQQLSKLVCGELAGDGSQREKPVRHRVWLWEFPK